MSTKNSPLMGPLRKSTTRSPAHSNPPSTSGSQQYAFFPLPLELLRNILDYLQPADLCKCEQVNSTWRDLVHSLDARTWRYHYFSQYPWALQPSWPFSPSPAGRTASLGNPILPDTRPRETTVPPPSPFNLNTPVTNSMLCTCTETGSWDEKPLVPLGLNHPQDTTWKDMYKVQYQWSLLWKRKASEADQQMCMFLGRRSKQRKVIHIGGPNADFNTVREAMESVRAYTTVLVAPGVYDEQVKISMPVPFEIIGLGAPSSVLITAMFDSEATTGRLANLHIKAPWFNDSPIRVRNGYLQVENCILSSGEIHIVHPGCIALRYCKLDQVTLNMSKTGVSVIEHCLLTHTEADLVCIEGSPKVDRNWIGQFMLRYTSKWLATCSRPTVASSTPKCFGTKITKHNSDCRFHRHKPAAEPQEEEDQAKESAGEGEKSKITIEVSTETTPLTEISMSNVAANESTSSNTRNVAGSSPLRVPQRRKQSPLSPLAGTSKSIGGEETGCSCRERDTKLQQSLPGTSSTKPSDPVEDCSSEPEDFDEEEEEDEEEETGFVIDPFDLSHSTQHLHELRAGKGCLLPDHAGLDPTALPNTRILHASSTLTALPPSPQPSPSCPHHHTPHTSKSHCLPKHPKRTNPSSTSSKSAAFESLASATIPETACGSHPCTSVGMLGRYGRLDKLYSLMEDKEVNKWIATIKGPLFLCCKFVRTNGAITLASNAHVTVINCEFSDVQYALKGVSDSKAILYRNVIHNTRGSAVYLKHGAFALIAGNDIHRTEEASIDIRRVSHPIVMYNKIHQSKRSGIVVMTQAGGRFEYNQIMNNQEPGIYILYKANPVVRFNCICYGKATGITVNEQGRGVIEDNLIYQNQRAGLYIRRQGDPSVGRNYIIDGQANGVLIADKGAGSISFNIIQGNAGCGIFLNSPLYPKIHANRICYNETHGIGFFPEGGSVSESRDSRDRFMPLVEMGEGDNSSSDSDDLGDAWIDKRSVSSSSPSWSWVSWRRVIRVQYNSIYSNRGCGIHCSDNHPIDIRSNALHGNRLHGLRLELPGLFGSLYGTPGLISSAGLNPPLRPHPPGYFAMASTSHPVIQEVGRTSRESRSTVRCFQAVGSSDTPWPTIPGKKGRGVVTEKQPSAPWHQKKSKMAEKAERKGCKRRTMVEICNNSLTCNGGCGIVAFVTKASAAGRVVLQGNGVYDNMEHGIFLGMEAEVTENDVVGNQASAVYAEGQAILTLKSNRLQSCRSPALYVASEKSALEAKDNAFYVSSPDQEVIKLDIVSCRLVHPIMGDPRVNADIRPLVCTGVEQTIPSCSLSSDGVTCTGGAHINLLSNTVVLMNSQTCQGNRVDKGGADRMQRWSFFHHQQQSLQHPQPNHLGSWNVLTWAPTQPSPRPHLTLPDALTGGLISPRSLAAATSGRDTTPSQLEELHSYSFVIRNDNSINISDKNRHCRPQCRNHGNNQVIAAAPIHNRHHVAGPQHQPVAVAQGSNSRLCCIL